MMTTRAPMPASFSAATSPMPEVAPVATMVLPFILRPLKLTQCRWHLGLLARRERGDARFGAIAATGRLPAAGFDRDPLALCWRERGREAAPRFERARKDRSMAKDQQGLTVTGSSRSAQALDRAVADYYALTGDP